jgi:mono/diheme cytochrome c family protein
VTRASLALLALAACDWSLHRMQRGPRCGVDESTELLANASCEQPPPDGIVAFDPEPPAPPPPITRALLVRGRDRFDRFCAPCHGLAGDGDSQVARAMSLRVPPSLVGAAAATLPDARILVTIERGYGVMPSYAMVLAPRDRFAVLHYVRALQQRIVELTALSPAQREEATRWLR